MRAGNRANIIDTWPGSPRYSAAAQVTGLRQVLNSQRPASSSSRGIIMPVVLTMQGFSRMMLVSVTAAKNLCVITAA